MKAKQNTVVEFLLDQCSEAQANVDAPDRRRYTPLHYAATVSNTRGIRLLLKHTANLEASSVSRESPLHVAVGNPEAVEILLDAGADPNSIDILTQTPLHMATQKSCVESVQLLISHGADIEAEDDEGKRAICHAITRNEASLVKEILQHAKQTNRATNVSFTDMITAITSAAYDVLRTLMSERENAVRLTDKGGRTLLHFAARQPSQDTIEYLLVSGSDPNAPAGNKKRTPLHDAAETGIVGNVRKLLAWGAGVETTDTDGRAPLYLAMTSCDIDTIRVLLAAQASVNARDGQGGTAIFGAAMRGSCAIVQLLLDHGADVNVVAKNGWTILHLATDHVDVIRLLVAHQADVEKRCNSLETPLHLASKFGDSDTVKFFLDNGADPSLVDEYDNTPIHSALKQGHNECAKQLLGHTIVNSVDLDQVNDSGLSPLHLAVQHCGSEITRKLLDHGVNFALETSEGTSCLALAVQAGRSNNLSILLSYGKVTGSGLPWESKIISAAYWKCIEVQHPECLKEMLIAKPSLIDEVSSDGFDGLQKCIWMSYRKLKPDRSLCMALLEAGANPFMRQRKDQQSAFGLAMVSRRNLDMRLVDACLRCVHGIPTLEVSFPELRVSTEFDSNHVWYTLEPLVKSTHQGTDADGWNLNHFLYQAEPRLQFKTSTTLLPEQRPRTPTCMVMHSRENSVACLVKISSSGLDVAFLG
jgi:serine/threonine-protein phosphatase 6 regulatory ankyrin repeat subunit B